MPLYGYENYCWYCDHDEHTCLGCGRPVTHAEWFCCDDCYTMEKPSTPLHKNTYRIPWRNQ